MLIAQFSDPHVVADGELAFGKLDTGEHLARSIAHINGMAPRPDVVLGTGDLTFDGRAAEYARLAKLLDELAVPCYVIPGNHDDRDNMRAALAPRYLPVDGEFLHYTVENYPLRLIALDTLLPGSDGGRLCPERLDWLERELARAPERATIVLLHHPPFKTHMKAIDELGLEGAEALAEIVRRYPRIERVLCGHVHRPIQIRWAGTVAVTAPATAHQFLLDLSPQAESRWGHEPPAILLHIWEPDAGVVTHTVYVGDYGEPQPFH